MIINQKIKQKINKQLLIHDNEMYSKFDFTKKIKIKKYNTEIIVISNIFNLKNILLFLYWYLFIIKFEHVVFIDNSNEGKLKPFIKYFENKINYIHKPGILSQSDLYNEYVNNSDAQWVFPVDDDEFLFISDKYDNNINQFLNTFNNTDKYKIAVNWLLFFNDKIIESTNDFYIDAFKYKFYKENSLLEFKNIDANNLIKSIVNTDIKHLYLNDDKNPTYIDANIVLSNKNLNLYKSFIDSFLNKTPIGTVHNPISKLNNNFIHAYNPAYNEYCIDLFYNDKLTNNYNDIFLAHYKYKTLDFIRNKLRNFKFTNISTKYKNEYYNEKTFLDYYNNITNNNLYYCDLLANLLNKYKDIESFKKIFNNL